MQYEALAWLCGGLSIYGLVGLLAVWNDKPSKMPYVCILFYRHAFIINIQDKCINSVVLGWLVLQAPKEFPYDNLRVELGGKP